MKILVVHGAGMNMRGKAQVEIFGPMTLPGYDTKIRAYADELGGEVEIFHSNIEGEVINRLKRSLPTVNANAPAQVFPKINVPVLVIHGMKDTALLSMGHNDTWDQVGKDTTVLMAPEANHFVQHDAADLVNGTIRSWLDLRSGK